MIEAEDEEIKLRAPRNNEWFRVHPGLEYRSETVLARDDDDVMYLVSEEMVPKLMELAPERLEHCMLFLAANEDGENFLWPVPLPVNEDHPAWRAMDQWICLEGIQ